MTTNIEQRGQKKAGDKNAGVGHGTEMPWQDTQDGTGQPEKTIWMVQAGQKKRADDGQNMTKGQD